ncbi:MAG: hypothetical protein M3S32_00555, partial [Acidobacteriota bacterium]|nr:hypothetical protein [Acidobacteriota bacterium]
MTFSLGNRKQLGWLLVAATFLVLVVVRWRSAPSKPAPSTSTTSASRSAGTPASPGAAEED